MFGKCDNQYTLKSHLKCIMENVRKLRTKISIIEEYYTKLCNKII